MQPFPASDPSSQCWATRAPRAPAYSSARRINEASCTPVPSSLNTLTPSAAISAIGASTWPWRPTVMHPAGLTSQHAPFARSSTWRTTAAESAGGLVLAIATTAVYPPRAAALAPLSIVSASSAPGSRRWACRSTSPGATTQSLASSTSAPTGPLAQFGRHFRDNVTGHEHIGPPAACRVDDGPAAHHDVAFRCQFELLTRAACKAPTFELRPRWPPGS